MRTVLGAAMVTAASWISTPAISLSFSRRRSTTLIRDEPTLTRPNDPEAADQPDLLGLRDRALIGMMVYSFARIGAVVQMKVSDYFVQGRRRWVRLHAKGGKVHDAPCHHRLDQCLHDYIEAAGITDDVDGYFFRAARRKSGRLTTNPLFQQDAHRIIRRRAKAAGIETRIGKSYLPRDRDHGVSEEQRQVGSGAADR
jgi:integrase